MYDNDDSMTQYFERPEWREDGSPAQLVALAGPLQGVYSLHDIVTTIGRRPDNVVHIGLQSISKHHGTITRLDGGAFTVRDENSTNGIYVNGRRIAPGVDESLTNGDTLALAETMFLFRISGNDATDQALVELELDAGAIGEEADRLLELYPEAISLRRSRT